ncbi:hypothetical protein ABIB73_000093 [Bradyrhizobium sp. F1.4.3]|uniref:hypothetical protein n=1 Tax=Bradyrhizobium sp. F1.4.3 TaxID=3156356 RepID=UPI003393F5E0
MVKEPSRRERPRSPPPLSRQHLQHWGLPVYRHSMAQLRNQRHELFANLIVQAPKSGMSNTACYLACGYNAEGNAAEVAASRLLSSDKIRQRIAELTAPIVKKTRTTVDTLAAQLDEVFAGAAVDKQWGAAGSAAALKAKLLGFMRDKLEVGAPGSFDDLHTVEEVADRMIEDSSSPAAVLEVLDAMRRLVEQRAAGAALNVTPTRWLSMSERRHRSG